MPGGAVPVDAATTGPPAWFPVAVERVERRARPRERSPLRESLALFGLSFIVYALLGWWLTVHLQAIPYDSAFRLTHAYFALHNDPAKLAAIGFVWPPLMTIVLLPFALIKPMATSLVALPLQTAMLGGLLLVVLNRTLALAGMGRLIRYALLLAFAANPLVVHYATNGMSEMLTFLLLSVALHQLLRWHLNGESHHLALCGVAMALGYLSRYELAPYAVAVFVAIAVLLIVQRRVARDELEGSLLLYAAPVAFAVAVWGFFNWAITGDALHFLDREVQERFVLEGARSVAEGGSGGASAEGWGDIARRLLDVNWQIFAVQFLVFGLLAGLGLLRRNLMALVLAGLMLINPLTTAVFVQGSDLSLLQLRFNMRAMPLVLIGTAWLFIMLKPGLGRRVMVGAVLAGMLASAPISWRAMEHYPYVFGERDFVRAVETGERQDPLDLASNRRMAAYVNAHVTRTRSVLVDDAQTFVPILVGGRPQLYFDRVDKGDEHWGRVLAHPVGKVDWLLMPANRGVIPDRVHARWSGALAGRVPFLRVVHREGNVVLVKVLRR